MYSYAVDVEFGGDRTRAYDAIVTYGTPPPDDIEPESSVDDEQRQRAALEAHLAKLGVRA